MGVKRRIQATAEPMRDLRSINDDTADTTKLASHSDHVDTQFNASDSGAGVKVNQRGEKREESLKTSVPCSDVTMPIQATAERGPRYFDPPDESRGNCYNCGEQGHRIVDCTAERKKKPCFLCGSTDHIYEKCRKGRGCVTCKAKGHKTKNCPEKSIYMKNGSSIDKICLRCGDYGHTMFSCKNNYFPIDLKVVQCYICNGFGHLCCYTSADHLSKGISCYKCGALGHTGLACARLVGENTDMSSPILCYNCHQGAHLARECPYPAMNTKSKDRDTSWRSQKTRSVEHYLAMYNEAGSFMWITENSSESTPTYRKANNEKRKRSLSTASSQKHQIHLGHKNKYLQQSGDLDSKRSCRSNLQSFPLSRFFIYSNNSKHRM